MARDILQEIIEKRKNDISKLGYELGFDIPKTRTRKIRPFIAEKGAILEVKRASPSKGDIAPNLDSAKTALEYAKAGAKAISCLTESNYFKGTLGDLMKVCSAMDQFETETGKIPPAVLRKDFLLNADEVEVAFRAGADAVLLISRILTKETMLEMAQKAASLGISVLIEVRKQEDLEKLAFVMKQVDHKYIVCGVNSRDLKDFTIDMLKPAEMLKEIKKIAEDARVTFESGILSPETAAFASSMGFNAFLMGEAAAKDPQNVEKFTKAFEEKKETPNGKSWVEYASNLSKEQPLVKICGMTRKEDAELACKLGADFLGFIFCARSKRNVSAQTVCEIKNSLADFAPLPVFVGVITEIDSPEANAAFELVREGIIDKIQFHGFEPPSHLNADFDWLPRYAAANVTNQEGIEKLKKLVFYGEPRVLIDSQVQDKIGGTGKTIDENLVQECSKHAKLWLAGGVTPENVSGIIEKFNPELIDIASGVESEPGIKDHEKMVNFFKNLNSKLNR